LERDKSAEADYPRLLVPLDFDARAPLHRQIYESVRDKILGEAVAAQ
jgi:hypothetical protein